MKPHELLACLLSAKGMNQLDLARALQRPGMQSTISRYLAGRVENPRAAWLEPVARYLQIPVEALRSEQAATAEAIAQGFGEGGALAARENVAQYRPRQAVIDAGVLVLQLADLVRAYDPATRRAVSALLDAVTASPEDAPMIASRLRGLLAAPPAKRIAGT